MSRGKHFKYSTKSCRYLQNSTHAILINAIISDEKSNYLHTYLKKHRSLMYIIIYECVSKSNVTKFKTLATYAYFYIFYDFVICYVFAYLTKHLNTNCLNKLI